MFIDRPEMPKTKLNPIRITSSTEMRSTARVECHTSTEKTRVNSTEDQWLPIPVMPSMMRPAEVM
ncbi:hypothetical protein D3C80_1286900 [compost metagenome]